MQVDQDKLKAENSNILGALREKTKKHQQTQELYDRLKRKEMTAATQSAAYDSVDEVLQSVASRHGEQTSFPRGPPPFNHFTGNHHTMGQQRHGREGSGGSGSRGGMMPPPPRRSGQSFISQALGSR